MSFDLSRRMFVSATFASSISSNQLALKQTPTTSEAESVKKSAAQPSTPTFPDPAVPLLDSDIANGVSPLQNGVSDWSALIMQIETRYGDFINVARGKSSFSDKISADLANLVPVPTGVDLNLEGFDPFHAEGLLNQAADLLERCMRDKLEWEERNLKRATLGLELADFVLNDEIHKEEIEAGFYNVASVMSAGETQAFGTEGFYAKSAESQTSFLLKTRLSDSETDEQSGNAQLLSWVSHVPNYGVVQPNMSRNLTWNGATKKGFEHAIEATADQTWWTFNVQQQNTSIQLATLAATRSAAETRRNAASYKSSYDAKDVDFKKRRVSVARRLAALKANYATQEGGVFNYQERNSFVFDRFHRDFQDATARLRATSLGLSKLYGYGEDLPDTTKIYIAAIDNGEASITDDIGNMTLLNETVIWVRNAIEWLVRFSHQEESYSISFSIRSLVQGEFVLSMAHRSVSFDIGADAFPAQRHVRLRGARMFIIGDPARELGTWGARLRVPSSSHVTHLDGTQVELDQRNRKSAWFGSIRTRQPQPSLGTSGTQTFYNCSPFGRWVIELTGSSSLNADISLIRDVEIELDVVVCEV